jgi:hypothetical protein
MTRKKIVESVSTDLDIGLALAARLANNRHTCSSLPKTNRTRRHSLPSLPQFDAIIGLLGAFRPITALSFE